MSRSRRADLRQGRDGGGVCEHAADESVGPLGEAAIDSALDTMHPHRLCNYLYETAVAFSSFYEACPIIAAESHALRASRLRLARTTGRVLTLGLNMLGIEAPERL